MTMPSNTVLTWPGQGGAIQVSGTGTVHGDAGVEGNLYLGSMSTIRFNTTGPAQIRVGEFASAVAFSGTIHPIASLQGDLGSNSFRWNNLFLSGRLTGNWWEMVGSNNGMSGPMNNDDMAAFTLTNAWINRESWPNVVPSGTGTDSAWRMWNVNQTGRSNGGFARFGINASTGYVVVDRSGTSAFLPLTFYTNGVQQWQIDTNGMLIGTRAGGPTAPTIQLPYQASINFKNSAGATRTALTWTGDNYNSIYCGDAGLLFTNYANSVRLGTLDNSGNLSVNGDVHVGNNLYVGFNRIYLFSDLTRSFYANGPTISYQCGASGNHSFEFTAGGAADVVCRNISASGGRLDCLGTAFVSDGTNLILYANSGGAVFTRATGMYIQNAQGGYVAVYASAFSVQSARRTKTDIRVIDDPLAIVRRDELHGVWYTERDTGRPRVGFIADDWLPFVPEVVELDATGEVMGLDYDKLSAVTFEAFKQYMERTDARIAALESELAAVRAN
jgi:hypothetical protein